MTETSILNVIGRFTPDGDIELSANGKALHELASILANKSTPFDVKLVIPNENPHPYEGYIEIINLEKDVGLVKISMDGNKLIIVGNDENIQALTDDIYWLAEGEQGSGTLKHLHIDYHPDHPYLSPESLSLVIVMTG